MSSADYGYTEMPIDDNTYRISFHGNQLTDPETVERYALFRSAELTASKGYDYFVVAENSNGSSTSGSTGRYGGSVGTEHMSSKTIKLFKGTKPADAASAYDAKTIMKNMEPYIIRD
jgi:hypothetical protein